MPEVFEKGVFAWQNRHGRVRVTATYNEINGRWHIKAEQPVALTVCEEGEFDNAWPAHFRDGAPFPISGDPMSITIDEVVRKLTRRQEEFIIRNAERPKFSATYEEEGTK